MVGAECAACLTRIPLGAERCGKSAEKRWPSSVPDGMQRARTCGVGVWASRSGLGRDLPTLRRRTPGCCRPCERPTSKHRVQTLCGLNCDQLLPKRSHAHAPTHALPGRRRSSSGPGVPPTARGHSARPILPVTTACKHVGLVCECSGREGVSLACVHMATIRFWPIAPTTQDPR